MYRNNVWYWNNMSGKKTPIPLWFFTFLLKKGVDKARLIYMNILRTLLARSAGGSQLLWGLKLAGKKWPRMFLVGLGRRRRASPRTVAHYSPMLCPLLPENRNQTIILYISKDIYGATNYLHLDLFILFFLTIYFPYFLVCII